MIPGELYRCINPCVCYSHDVFVGQINTGDYVILMETRSNGVHDLICAFLWNDRSVTVYFTLRGNFNEFFLPFKESGGRTEE